MKDYLNLIFSLLSKRNIKKFLLGELDPTSATVGRILVSDKTFNIPVVAIHCSNAQNVGFENPTYKIIPNIIL